MFPPRIVSRENKERAKLYMSNISLEGHYGIGAQVIPIFQT